MSSLRLGLSQVMVKTEEGEELDFEVIIKDTLTDDAHVPLIAYGIHLLRVLQVWILTKDEV